MRSFFSKLLKRGTLERFFNQELTKTRIALENSEKRFRTIFENNSSSIMIIERDSTITMFNNAYYEMTGYSSEEVIGHSWTKLVPESELDRLKEYNRLRFRGSSNIPNIYEFRFNKKDGSIRVGLMSVFFDNFLNQIVVSIIDITDRKNIENELKKNESELKALNTTKDKLFSIIAHDLRGPVGTSADLLDVMIENYSSLSNDEQLKMLEILKNSAKSTFNLLETLLNWTVIQTGNLVFKPEIFSLTKCIESIVEDINPTAFSKNISLLFNPKEEIIVFTDQNMMQTVLRNLIGNAIKYTSRGGTIVVKTENQGNNSEIFVIDNGVGMDEETRKNLFHLNKQNSKYGTENEKGSGLGLILCKEFVEKQGGKLIVESELGKGSTFMFNIPKILNQQEVQKQKPVEASPESRKFNNELVLIVEDEEINYHILRSILTSVNLKYERANTGKKAVDMFLHNNYSLILMDIQLSEMNGWEATMKIREIDSEIPIIAVTAYASDPNRKKSLEAGCNDYITKPINKIKLVQLINKYLNKSRII